MEGNWDWQILLATSKDATKLNKPGSTCVTMTRRAISTKPHRSGGTPIYLYSGSPTTIPEFAREVTWLEVAWHVKILLLEGPGAHGRWCCRRRVRHPAKTTVAQPPSRSPVGVGAAGTAGTFVSPTCSSSRSSFAPPVECECGRRLSVALSRGLKSEACESKPSSPPLRRACPT